MRALVFLTGTVGLTLLVFWSWRQQMSATVPPTPPLVDQLERLAEQGELGGAAPGELAATLVFSDPFTGEAPWDLAPAGRSAMGSWFGEPRQYDFTSALEREPATVAWRLDAASPRAFAAEEAQAAAALSWAAAKGVRLRVVAHGRALDPVLRAAFAAPAGQPALARVVGVGVRLAELKARDPGLFAALAARAPAGQWVDLYSDPSVVPRVLVLERVGPGPAATAQEAGWPGDSWVTTVAGLAERGVAAGTEALPALTRQGMMSVRQFRSLKDGRVTQRVVDGKGRVVTGSLIVPKLEKEEIPPDPLAAEEAAAADQLPIGATGWTLKRSAEFTALVVWSRDCILNQGLVDGDGFRIAVDCYARKAAPPDIVDCRGFSTRCVPVSLHGHPAVVTKERPPIRGAGETTWEDQLWLAVGDSAIAVSYTYPDPSRRDERLDAFMHAIQALEPPGQAAFAR